MLADALLHNPDLIARLPDFERLRTRPKPALVESARKALAWRDDVEERQSGLRRWKERHLVGIAARDVLGEADVATVGRDVSALAEASLEVALEALDASLPFAVIALGRFGGAELSYASDLDVLFVYEGPRPLTSRKPRSSRPRSVASSAVRPLRLGSGRSTRTCVPRASKDRWRAASRASRRTSPAGRWSGSDRR